jgi:hypothetical protein
MMSAMTQASEPGPAIELSPEQFVGTLQSFIDGRPACERHPPQARDLQGDGGQRPQIGLE